MALGHSKNGQPNHWPAVDFFLWDNISYIIEQLIDGRI